MGMLNGMDKVDFVVLCLVEIEFYEMNTIIIQIKWKLKDSVHSVAVPRQCNNRCSRIV